MRHIIERGGQNEGLPGDYDAKGLKQYGRLKCRSDISKGRNYCSQAQNEGIIWPGAGIKHMPLWKNKFFLQPLKEIREKKRFIICKSFFMGGLL